MGRKTRLASYAAAQGVTSTVSGAANLTGTGTLTATPTGTLTAVGAANLTGTGTLTATPIGTQIGAAALTGTGSLSATGIGALSNNTVAILGDSRPAEVNGGGAATAGFMHCKGFMTWARRYSGGAADFNEAVMFAVGGYSTRDVVNNKLAACASSSAASVLVMVGVNDWGKSVPTSESLSNIDTIASTLVTAGKTVFFCDDAPASGQTTAGYTQQDAIRDHIRAMTNVTVVPTWNAAAASPDSNTIGAGYENENDSPPPTANPHFGPDAASRVGQAVATAMTPYLPAFDLFGRSGVLAGGEFTGTGGAKSGGVTGTVPNGWTVALESGTGTVVCSSAAAGGHTWLVITLTGGSAPIIGVYTPSLASGWTAGTDYVDMAVKCQVDSGSVKLQEVQLMALRESSTVLRIASGVRPAGDGAIVGNTTDCYGAYAMDMTLWLPKVKYPAGATALVQRMEIKGSPTLGTSSGVVRFALPQLRKYTGSLTD